MTETAFQPPLIDYGFDDIFHRKLSADTKVRLMTEQSLLDGIYRNLMAIEDRKIAGWALGRTTEDGPVSTPVSEVWAILCEEYRTQFAQNVLDQVERVVSPSQRFITIDSLAKSWINDRELEPTPVVKEFLDMMDQPQCSKAEKMIYARALELYMTKKFGKFGEYNGTETCRKELERVHEERGSLREDDLIGSGGAPGSRAQHSAKSGNRCFRRAGKRAVFGRL